MTTFSQATITKSAIANFFRAMRPLGFTYVEIREQADALSDKYSRDDQAFIAALEQARKDAEMKASYHAVDKMRREAVMG